MYALPALILLSLTVAFGLYLGQAFLRRQPRRPMVIGLHLLFALGSLEGLVIALHADVEGGSIVDSVSSAGPDRTAITMLALIALALFTGLVRSAIGRSTRAVATTTLALHAGLAAAGFATALSWIAHHFMGA